MTNTWDAMKTWELVLPPSRPSIGELSAISDRLSDVPRDSPVAVLGSTPEFRDLLHELGYTRIFVLDRNAPFYRAMSETRIHRNREEFLHGDWLETLPNYRGMFTVILSDLTMGNVPYERRAEFYDCLADALAPYGIFIDKVLTHPGAHIPVVDLIEKYSRAPLNLLTANHFSCEVLFCSELIADGRVDSTRIYDELERTVRDRHFRAVMNAALAVTPRGCLWFYGRPWCELERAYGGGLRRVCINEDEPGSPYYGRLKVFFQERS
jgi:hypothetical protein